MYTLNTVYISHVFTFSDASCKIKSGANFSIIKMRPLCCSILVHIWGQSWRGEVHETRRTSLSADGHMRTWTRSELAGRRCEHHTRVQDQFGRAHSIGTAAAMFWCFRAFSAASVMDGPTSLSRPPFLVDYIYSCYLAGMQRPKYLILDRNEKCPRLNHEKIYVIFLEWLFL